MPGALHRDLCAHSATDCSADEQPYGRANIRFDRGAFGVSDEHAYPAANVSPVRYPNRKSNVQHANWRPYSAAVPHSRMCGGRG